eukprot:480228-Rhodomonas_salina.3
MEASYAGSNAMVAFSSGVCSLRYATWSRGPLPRGFWLDANQSSHVRPSSRALGSRWMLRASLPPFGAAFCTRVEMSMRIRPVSQASFGDCVNSSSPGISSNRRIETSESRDSDMSASTTVNFRIVLACETPGGRCSNWSTFRSALSGPAPMARNDVTNELCAPASSTDSPSSHLRTSTSDRLAFVRARALPVSSRLRVGIVVQAGRESRTTCERHSAHGVVGRGMLGTYGPTQPSAVGSSSMTSSLSSSV